MNRVSLSASLVTALCLGAALGWHWRGIHDAGKPPAQPGKSAMARLTATGAKAPAPPESAAPTPPPVAYTTADLADALKDGLVTADFRGNHRDLLRATFTNHSGKPLRLSLPAGQAFEGPGGVVILPRPSLFDFKEEESRSESLATLAVASSNHLGEAPLSPVSRPEPKLAALLEYLADHPEVSTPAAQTAALAILENLPASAFAKFSEPAAGDLPQELDTNAFRVEAVDILQALLVLRQMGLPEEQFAITVDPQTKIEAMIDPLAHALAMQYYGIRPEDEWSFWKHQLLEGDPSTRHYALHGIARYYPDIALPMLPRWAREPRTDMVLRLVAIRALAETRRADALSILKGLEYELGPGTELGKAAHDAAAYLESVLNKSPEDPRPVLFRVNKAPELGRD